MHTHPCDIMWYSRIGFNCIIQPLKPLSAASENPLWSSPRMPGYWWTGQREEDLWWLKKHQTQTFKWPLLVLTLVNTVKKKFALKKTCRILVKKTAIEASESLGSCVHSTWTRMSINNHGSQPAPERGAQRTAMGRKPSLVLKSSSIAWTWQWESDAFEGPTKVTFSF